MASFEVLHRENGSFGSNESDEYSFLPEVSAGRVPNGDINPVNFDMTNMQSALPATTDSSVEVHSYVLELIKGNNSLKDALNVNNSLMKEKMSIISQWRDVMIQSRNQMQQSLQEAEEKISTLDKENANLLEKLQIKDCIKCKTLETTLKNFLGEEDFIKKNKSILCCELNRFHANLQQNLIAVCHHLDDMLKNKMGEEEKKLLKTFVLLLKFKITTLDGDYYATVHTDEETGYEVVHQKEHKDKTKEGHLLHNSEIYGEYEALKESVNEKDEELILLRKENKELDEKMKSYSLKLQELEITLKSQFELMNNKLAIESSLTEKYKERCESMQQQIEEYQIKLDKAKMSDEHNVHELRDEIQNLQDILKLEQRANQRDKEELSKVMLRCEELQVDFDRVTKILEMQSRDEKKKNDEITSLRETDAKENLEKFDHLTAQLFEVQEQLAESNAVIRQLRQELTVANEGAEEIPILKAQIQVYKTDYENVLASRDSDQQEVLRLTDELKKQEKKSGCVCKACPSTSRKRLSASSKHPNLEDENSIMCPICEKGFKNIQAASNHINRCIEDSNPTTS